MLNGVDLFDRLVALDTFSGIVGGAYALGAYVRPIAYCEINDAAQGIILERQQGGEVPVAPIWDDIRTLTAEHLSPLLESVGRTGIDILYGGFPCQDLSNAGSRVGLEGKRSGLFFELHRLTRECRPTFVFLENVPGIRTRGAATVARSLSELGYDLRWTIVSAEEVGAPHRRNRWFLLAADPNSRTFRDWRKRHPKGNSTTGLVLEYDGSPGSLANAARLGWTEGEPELGGLEGRSHALIGGRTMADASSARDGGLSARSRGEGQGAPDPDRRGETVANAHGFCAGSDAEEFHVREPEFGRDGEDVADRDRDRERLEIRKQGDARKLAPFERGGWWSTKSRMGGSPHGIPAGLDRIEGLDIDGEETGAEEILQDLREGVLPEAIQRATRGMGTFHAEEFLFSVLREHARGGRISRKFLAGAVTPEGLLREMQINSDSSRASRRRRSVEQYFREYPNALRELSLLVASRGETPWSHPLWEGAVSRIATGIPERVDRLEGLGNAWVPLQALVAFERLIGL